MNNYRAHDPKGTVFRGAVEIMDYKGVVNVYYTPTYSTPPPAKAAITRHKDRYRNYNIIDSWVETAIEWERI